LPVKRGKGLAAAVGAAIVLAAAALVVGIIALVRPAPAPPLTSAPTSSSAHPTGTMEANRAFCNDIAPLMTESNKTAQAYSRLGKGNTPEWKAGVPTFVSETKAWIGEIQPVIDSHGDADPFLLRSMQRFVDDRRYLVADLEAGEGAEWMPYDQTNWDDSLSALNGPLTVCWPLGVKW
jgi:hypothetical protein